MYMELSIIIGVGLPGAAESSPKSTKKKKKKKGH